MGPAQVGGVPRQQDRGPETPETLLFPDVTWEHSETVAASKPRDGPQEVTCPAGAFVLGLPAPEL